MCAGETNEAVRVLDLLLEFFAHGAHWTGGRYDDGQGPCCLIGRQYLHSQHHASSEAAARFLKEAMPAHRGACVLH